MKRIISCLKLTAALLFSLSSLGLGEESKYSYSGVLFEKFSIDFESTTLVGSVAEIRKELMLKYPAAFDLRVVFENTHRITDIAFSKDDDPLKFRDEELFTILENLGSRYRHKVEYRVEKSEIVFSAIIPRGEVPERFYSIPLEVSEDLGLSWDSEQSPLDSLSRMGWTGDLKKVNLENRSFIAISSAQELEYLAMSIYVSGYRLIKNK